MNYEQNTGACTRFTFKRELAADLLSTLAHELQAIMAFPSGLVWVEAKSIILDDHPDEIC